MARLSNVIVGINQTLNALLAGHPAETISSRAWRRSVSSRRWSAARIVIDALFAAFGQREHCLRAWQAARERARRAPYI